MKNKKDKKKDLEQLKKTLAENKNFFVTSYEKMTRQAGFRTAQNHSRRGRRLFGC